MQDDLQRSMGRVESKLDAVLDHQRQYMEKHDKLETRIGSVENKLHWYSGIIAASMAGLTVFGEQIRKLFS